MRLRVPMSPRTGLPALPSGYIWIVYNHRVIIYDTDLKAEDTIFSTEGVEYSRRKLIRLTKGFWRAWMKKYEHREFIGHYKEDKTLYPKRRLPKAPRGLKWDVEEFIVNLRRGESIVASAHEEYFDNWTMKSLRKAARRAKREYKQPDPDFLDRRVVDEPGEYKKIRTGTLKALPKAPKGLTWEVGDNYVRLLDEETNTVSMYHKNDRLPWRRSRLRSAARELKWEYIAEESKRKAHLAMYRTLHGRNSSHGYRP